MNRLIKRLDKLVSVWCYSLMGILTVCIIATVILRYLFNITFVKAEEAITMVFIATTFFGAALGIREKDHIAIGYFQDIAPPIVRKFMSVLVHLVIIFVMLLLCRYSLQWIERVGRVPTPAMQIPSKFFYIMVPITSILAIFYAIVNITALFVAVEEPDYGYERDEIVPEGACEDLIEEELL